MKRHIFMSMLYLKIKFEIDIDNDEKLEVIWKHEKIKKGGRGWDIIKLIKLYFLIIILILLLHFQSEV